MDLFLTLPDLDKRVGAILVPIAVLLMPLKIDNNWCVFGAPHHHPGHRLVSCSTDAHAHLPYMVAWRQQWSGRGSSATACLFHSDLAWARKQQEQWTRTADIISKRRSKKKYIKRLSQANRSQYPIPCPAVTTTTTAWKHLTLLGKEQPQYTPTFWTINTSCLGCIMTPQQMLREVSILTAILLAIVGIHNAAPVTRK